MTAVLVSLLVAPFLHAQTFEQLAAVRVTEAQSSVRGTAMGAAADVTAGDAGALITNPAAAAGLKRISFSAAASDTSWLTESIRGSGNYYYSFHDRIESAGVSQLAFAVPAGRVVISGYFAQQPRVQSETPVALHPSGHDSYSDPQCEGACGYLYEINPGFDRHDRRYGVTAAWRAGRFDLGAGGEVRQLDERTGTGRVVIGGEEWIPQRLFRTTSGTSIVPVAGIVWHASPRLALGASYKGGGSFERTSAACLAQASGVPFCRTETAELNRTKQRMPGAIEAGASFQATHALLVTASAIRRDYGRFAREPYSIMGTPERMPYRDVTETHAGAEYRLARWPVSLRAGWWRDPSRFVPQFFPSDWVRDFDHITYGVGVNLNGTELALAVDDGGTHGGRSASVSLVHSF